MISFKNIRPIIMFLLLAFTAIASAQISQIPVAQAEQAKQKLADKGIAEDEAQKRLKAKGIDLDNLRLEQLPSLENSTPFFQVIGESLLPLKRIKTSLIKNVIIGGIAGTFLNILFILGISIANKLGR